MTANELRQHFGVVPQETVLFSGRIYDNLALANPMAGFEQIVQACKLAEIHEAIEALPNGYQTEIGEHGAGLSGGQKQRIAIARALLKGPARAHLRRGYGEPRCADCRAIRADREPVQRTRHHDLHRAPAAAGIAGGCGDHVGAARDADVRGRAAEDGIRIAGEGRLS
jgi:ABC-type Na+ transport system ATPase subunit NatA